MQAPVHAPISPLLGLVGYQVIHAGRRRQNYSDSQPTLTRVITQPYHPATKQNETISSEQNQDSPSRLTRTVGLSVLVVLSAIVYGGILSLLYSD